MQLVYFSLTGQTRRFIDKLEVGPGIDLGQDPYLVMTEPYLLFVPTYPLDMMMPVFDFLEDKKNRDWCRGIIGSGNRNFAQDFCFTAYEISQKFDLPVRHCYEFQGNAQDVDLVKELMKCDD